MKPKDLQNVKDVKEPSEDYEEELILEDEDEAEDTEK